jgi:aspartyl-tRNA(Asn)/glutamyl-tRNA(Gln) amidotransferase subunit A
MKKALDGLHARFDALIAPTRGTVSSPIAKDFDKAYPGLKGGPPLVPAGIAVGQPALPVPNGFGQKGLPTGLMLQGRVWGEAMLLAIARAYQQATAWQTKRPALP